MKEKAECGQTSEWWLKKQEGAAAVVQQALLLLPLLRRFSRVRLCATPQMAAHQAPLSPGFCRQEHWSGLPFPSLVHESEKWKWSRSVVSDSSRPHGLQPTRLLCPWDFPGKSTGVGCHHQAQWAPKPSVHNPELWRSIHLKALLNFLI